MTTETVQFTELVREAHARPRAFDLKWCHVCLTETTFRFVRVSGGWEFWRCSVCGIRRGWRVG